MKEEKEQESVTRPQPLQEEEEEEAGEEERQELASHSVKKEEEWVEPDMPSVQVKPEPQEMECTVRSRGRWGW